MFRRVPVPSAIAFHVFIFPNFFFIILFCLKNICCIFLLGWKCCSNILQFNCGICSPFFTFTCAHVLWPSFCFLDSLGKWRNLIQSICLSHFRASFLPWPHVHSFISNVCVWVFCNLLYTLSSLDEWRALVLLPSLKQRLVEGRMCSCCFCCCTIYLINDGSKIGASFRLAWWMPDKNNNFLCLLLDICQSLHSFVWAADAAAAVADLLLLFSLWRLTFSSLSLFVWHGKW